MYEIIVNKASRTGKAAEIWERLEKLLQERDVQYNVYFTEYGGHATELATSLCEKRVENQELILLVVGGDGTVNEVVNGITDFEHTYFGYIPTGSGNDLGRGLGISSVDPVERLASILNRLESSADSWDNSMPEESMIEESADASNSLFLRKLQSISRDMDLGEVKVPGQAGRKFTISAGIGIDADVCKQALNSKLKKALNAIHMGSATYGLLTVKTLFTMPLADGVAILDGEEEFPLKQMIFSAAMNHRCEGGGVPMAPGADAYDGLLSMCMVQGIKRGACFLAFPKLLAGKHENIEGFRLVNVKTVTLKLKSPLVIHADGEYVGTETEVSFTCLPGLLHVIL